MDAKRWGGKPEDYYPIHAWLDESKTFYANFRHRALRHHTEGIGQALKLFGSMIKVGRRRVSVRLICEHHIKEDLGWLPSVQDWMCNIRAQRWMFDDREARKRVVEHNKQARLARRTGATCSKPS
jgi:hypothetical protein